MPAIVRQGDFNSAGGITVYPVTKSVIVNGRPLAQPGTLVTPHPCCGADGCEIHCAAIVIGPGSPSVIIEGKPAIPVGSLDICGHVRITGSPDVMVPGGGTLGTIAGIASAGFSLYSSGVFSAASGPVAKAGSYNPALKS
jgi:uncharacterized Zn-binding protein involved in type VI secretion